MRYPDYYGIDMAKMSEFIAFKAAVEMLKEREMRDVIAVSYTHLDVYKRQAHARLHDGAYLPDVSQGGRGEYTLTGFHPRCV